MQKRKEADLLNTDRISIVVPMYNVQNYIERCLDSISNQTYHNIEIILVDDGSTDNTRLIVKEYLEKDERIVSVHIENGGVSNARNVGLSYVTGQWFTFIDADDWVEPDYVEVLLRNASLFQCDVSGGTFIREYNYKMGHDKSSCEVRVLDSSEECIHNFICSGLSLNGICTTKLYRSEKFLSIRFDSNLKVNEDCMYVYHVLKNCTRACVSSEVIYHWFMREDSACHKKPTKPDFSAANVFLNLMEKTEYLHDEEVITTLKVDYFKNVLHTLLYVNVDRNQKEIREVLERLNLWIKDVWGSISKKEKVCYYLVVKFDWLLCPVRKIKNVFD